jgi:hypothetical protein
MHTHRERRRTQKKDAALRLGIERYLHTAIGGIICKTMRSTSALVHILPLVIPRLIIPEPILPLWESGRFAHERVGHLAGTAAVYHAL